VEDLYAEKGYILAKVRKVQDDPDGYINIDIDEGIVDEVEISGNIKTKDYVIKREINVKPGDVYNEKKLKQDIARIFGLRAFSDVRRVISPSIDDPSKYKLTVEVDEKRTGSVSLGGGIDTETGLFGQAGYVDTNLFGRGQELGANFLLGSGAVIENDSVLNKAPFQVELKFVEPRLRNTMNSLEIRGFGEEMASYQVPLSTERRIGGELELARPIKKIPNLAGSVSMGVENIKVSEGDFDQISELFRDKGINISERAKQLQGGTYVSLGPSLVYDSRNAVLNPTNGWYATTNFKESVGITGGSDSFGKVGASVRKFFPVGKKSTFTLAARAGSTVFGDAPDVQAFRLGGPYTIRGFREGDVGNGQGILLGSAEFRTPIPFLDKYLDHKILRDIRLALFMDAGKTFKNSITNTIYDYPGKAISIGAGVIVPLPYLGPIRFDYGYPITAIIGGNKKGTFSFGIGDRY
jgi:outer membrane protein insertion porin family